MKILSTPLQVGLLSLMMVLGAGSAQAALMTERFEAVIDFGPAAGETGTLDVSWDSTSITGVGFEELRFNLFDVTLSILDSIFNETADASFPEFPRLGFFNGVVDTLDFVVADPAPGLRSISGFLIEDGVYSMDSVAAVPLPGTAVLALLGMAALARQRRRSSNA